MLLLLLLGLCVFRLDLVQSDLQVIIDNIEMKVHEEYFEDCEAEPCENDDMLAVFSFRCNVLKELPADAMMNTVLIGMVNGEPTEPTGVDMEVNMCQLVNDAVIVGPLFSAMNVPSVCPVQPVNMLLECYEQPMDNFPDFFLPGEYKFIFNLTYQSTHLFLMEIYLTLY